MKDLSLPSLLWAAVGTFLRPAALMALSKCRRLTRTALAPLTVPLGKIDWPRLRRDSRRTPLHGRILYAPEGCGWRICTGPHLPNQAGGGGVGPVDEHEYLRFRTALAVWHGHSRRQVDPTLRVLAWPDHC